MLRVNEIPEDKIIFYDIETGPPDPLPEGVSDIVKGAVSATYCKLHMIACQVGLNGEPELVETVEQKELFRARLRDPNIIKVSYNGVNFDDIVLWRFKYYVEPRGRHDMYLALKTVAPTLPSYSLKFANRYYLGDWHEPERRLWAWIRRHRKGQQMYAAPKELLSAYCKHDVRQTVNIFRMIWEAVQEKNRWKAYRTLELAMAEPLHEMVLLGGEFVDPDDIERRIKELEESQIIWNDRCIKWSDGKVDNAISNKQLPTYLHNELGEELERSEAGNFVFRKAVKLGILTGHKEVGNTELERKSRRGIGTSMFSTELKSDLYANHNYINFEVIDKLEYKDLKDNKDLIKLILTNCSYEVADIIKVIGYLRSYLNAARYQQQRRTRNNSQGTNGRVCVSNSGGSIQEIRHRAKSTISKTSEGNHSRNGLVKIPKSYYVSSARTRRMLSSSMFGINFQNQNKRSKVIQLVPPGWLGVWIDSTQIENVVHIWASSDETRRESYEADRNWSEYVWLCNQVLGGNRDRKALEGIESPVNPAWSIYKQFKTIKLALNFGMGADKFSKTTGLNRRDASKMFEQVHDACPAIRELQNLIRSKIIQDGFIEDSFGHIYSGPIKQIYKVVSYLVQGMGTGSFPKAMTVANYETLHALDSDVRLYFPFIRHPYKQIYSYGVLNGTTHDECALRISLGLPEAKIVQLVRELMFNMEERFSKYVDGIPLRAKIAFSITNAADQEEMDHKASDFEKQLLEKYIRPGKKNAASIINHRPVH